MYQKETCVLARDLLSPEKETVVSICLNHTTSHSPKIFSGSIYCLVWEQSTQIAYKNQQCCRDSRPLAARSRGLALSLFGLG